MTARTPETPECLHLASPIPAQCLPCACPVPAQCLPKPSQNHTKKQVLFDNKKRTSAGSSCMLVNTPPTTPHEDTAINNNVHLTLRAKLSAGDGIKKRMN